MAWVLAEPADLSGGKRALTLTEMLSCQNRPFSAGNATFLEDLRFVQLYRFPHRDFPHRDYLSEAASIFSSKMDSVKSVLRFLEG